MGENTKAEDVSSALHSAVVFSNGKNCVSRGSTLELWPMGQLSWDTYTARNPRGTRHDVFHATDSGIMESES